MNMAYGLLTKIWNKLRRAKNLALVVVIIILIILLIKESLTKRYFFEKPTNIWRAREITFVIDDSVNLVGPNAPQEIINAFEEWTSKVNNLPKIRFDRACCLKPEQDGINSITFQKIDKTYKTIDPAKTIGYTLSYTNTLTYNNKYMYSVIRESDIVINSAQNVSAAKKNSCEEEYSLKYVVMHEAGHFFGLEDVDDASSIMNEYIPVCVENKISEKDINNLYKTYSFL